jgi:hypothetical protein
MNNGKITVKMDVPFILMKKWERWCEEKKLPAEAALLSFLEKVALPNRNFSISKKVALPNRVAK